MTGHRRIPMICAAVAVASLLAVPASPAGAQTTREHILGGLGGRSLAGTSATRKVTSVEGTADAKAVVQQIVSLIGIPMTKFEVRASTGVANATATTERGGKDRLVLYNPAWMENLRSSTTNWSDWVVLAHEVGHHVAQHMDPSFPNHEAELQADYFAGFILQKLGAPRSDVQLAMAMVSDDEATLTHPAKAQRVAMVRKGWDAAAGGAGANVIPAALSVGERPAMAAAPAPPEQRVALLIGNTNYKTWGAALKNPRNDVVAVGQQLRALGFATTIVYDGRSDQIAAALEDFRQEAARADWAIVYFAGTGIEVDGHNYMVPIDADAARALTFTQDYPKMRIDTAFEAVKAAKRLRLVITDACRIDPATHNRAGTHRPVFKVVEPPRGVLVAYSTAAGQEALDGAGDLSPYAEAFIAGLREPGIEMDMIFRRVSVAVEEATKGLQVPTVMGNWPAERLFVSRK